MTSERLLGMTITGTRWWGASTPIGGATLLAGWVLFVWGVLAQKA